MLSSSVHTSEANDDGDFSAVLLKVLKLCCLANPAVLLSVPLAVRSRVLFVFFCLGKVMAALLVDLLKEDLNEELYMAREAGLGLNLYLTKVCKPPHFVFGV